MAFYCMTYQASSNSYEKPGGHSSQSHTTDDPQVKLKILKSNSSQTQVKLKSNSSQTQVKSKSILSGQRDIMMKVKAYLGGP